MFVVFLLLLLLLDFLLVFIYVFSFVLLNFRYRKKLHTRSYNNNKKTTRMYVGIKTWHGSHTAYTLWFDVAANEKFSDEFNWIFTFFRFYLCFFILKRIVIVSNCRRNKNGKSRKKALKKRNKNGTTIHKKNRYAARRDEMCNINDKKHTHNQQTIE